MEKEKEKEKVKKKAKEKVKMKEKKVEVVNCHVKQQYPFEGFNIDGEGPTQLMSSFSQWINEGLYKYHAKKDCGLFVAAYAEFLSDGLQVPSYGIISQTLRMRYASLLWNYGILKARSSYVNNNEDPWRPRPKKAKFDENVMAWAFEAIPHLRHQVTVEEEISSPRILRWLRAKNVKNPPDLFNPPYDAVVHPWLVPTEKELQMPSLITIGLVETLFDLVVDNVKREFLGATTIKRARLDDQQLVVFNEDDMVDAAVRAGVNIGIGAGVGFDVQSVGGTSCSRCSSFLCEKYKKHDEYSIIHEPEQTHIVTLDIHLHEGRMNVYDCQLMGMEHAKFLTFIQPVFELLPKLLKQSGIMKNLPDKFHNEPWKFEGRWEPMITNDTKAACRSYSITFIEYLITMTTIQPPKTLLCDNTVG
uniref:Ulp1 protease family, C-terminal catalytic domain containing protein n=1 Tax=Solanum tuberosum TaxID=4113 RepID=M0ZQJ0_SOLTU